MDFWLLFDAWKAWYLGVLHHLEGRWENAEAPVVLVSQDAFHQKLKEEKREKIG